MTAVLAIGAADSSGAHGITVYSRVTGEYGLQCLPVTACVVARGGENLVRVVNAVPPSIIARQIDAAWDFRPGACVVGMLARHQSVDIVDERISRRELRNVVLAPELGISRGRALMTARGMKQTARRLLRKGLIVVCDEETAGIMSGVKAHGKRFQERAIEVGRRLQDCGAEWALIAGNGSSTCVLVGQQVLEYEYTMHGVSGHRDALSTAIACRLALGNDVEQAVCESVGYMKRFGIKGNR